MSFLIRKFMTQRNSTSPVVSPTHSLSRLSLDEKDFCPIEDSSASPSSSKSASPPQSPAQHHSVEAPPPIQALDDDSPFAVGCPYAGCHERMEAKDFFMHAFSKHSKDGQGLACPICTLLTGNVFQPTSATNLLQHLSQAHAEFNPLRGPGSSISSSQDGLENLTEEQMIALCDTGSFIREGDQAIPAGLLDKVAAKLGTKYVVDTVNQTKEGWECIICFEDIVKGDSIARMDCFCIFHQHCLERWFQRQSRCPLHKD